MNQFDRLFSMNGLSLERMRSFLAVAEAGNIAKAAGGDPTRQSQFSRQIKELEGFFGVPLTRLVGRRIEITPEGQRLAQLIRLQFQELHAFRESMNGRGVCLRIGAQGSVIDWLMLPRLTDLRAALGGALIEFETMRSAEVVRAVTDGRLDLGIVRHDAVEKGHKVDRVGTIRYALFASKQLWKGSKTPAELLARVPVAELLPGGQFATRWQHWLDDEGITAQRGARLSSFNGIAQAVKSGQTAGILPEIAAAELKGFTSHPIPALGERRYVLIANRRGLDRANLDPSVTRHVSNLLKP